jgi:hypothetical protein
MKVFITWSGDKSGALAEILKNWIPAVIQAVRPYYSVDDIAKGSRWTNEIAKELEEARVGILCLTPDNLTSPWLMFEAGALSRNLDRTRVCPILFGIESTDLKGPLPQFQHCNFEKSDIKRLMQTINSELGQAGLPSESFNQVFDMWWPRLEEDVRKELERFATQKPEEVRSERDILEEVLQLTRMTSRKRSSADISRAAAEDLQQRYVILARDSISFEAPPIVLRELLDMYNPVRYIVARVLGNDSSDTGRIRLFRVRENLEQALAAADESDEVEIREEDFEDIPF